MEEYTSEFKKIYSYKKKKNYGTIEKRALHLSFEISKYPLGDRVKKTKK